MAPAVSHPPGETGIWSADPTTPVAIEAALSRLEADRSGDDHVHVPARVQNLVIVVDDAWKGEIANRLDRLDDGNQARTIVVIVEPGRTALGATAIVTEHPGGPGDATLFHERIEISCGTEHPALLWLGWLSSRLGWDPEPLAFDPLGEGAGVAATPTGLVFDPLFRPALEHARLLLG